MSPRPALLLALLCLASPAAALADDGGYTNWAPDDSSGQSAPAPDPADTGQTPATDTEDAGLADPATGVPYPSSGQTVDPLEGRTPAIPMLPDPGPRLKVKVRTSGRVAVIRKGLPRAIRQIVNAGNRIAKLPYRYGGGHGSFSDTAYDCSGSLAYALHAAGLVDATLDSTMFEHWGVKGKGRWITVYANSGHAWMVVAGLRFDTVALAQTGSRWTPDMTSTRGFVARHPAGF
jgi:hypothetical protein